VDPRGFPTSLPEFQRVFPDDRACATLVTHLCAEHAAELDAEGAS
jgi:hypothetical protein